MFRKVQSKATSRFEHRRSAATLSTKSVKATQLLSLSGRPTSRLGGGFGIRSFIAIEPPSIIVEGLRDIQEELKVGSGRVSWVRPENIHLTLKFLGEVEEKRLQKVLHTIKEAASSHAIISLSAEGLGCFPNIADPRVVWIGIVSDGGALSSFQRDMETGLERIGFRKEKRRYHPHLTLGRIRSLTDKRGWKELVNRFKDVRLGTFKADRIVLVRSDLNPKGAVHTRLGEAGFKIDN